MAKKVLIPRITSQDGGYLNSDRGGNQLTTPAKMRTFSVTLRSQS